MNYIEHLHNCKILTKLLYYLDFASLKNLKNSLCRSIKSILSSVNLHKVYRILERWLTYPNFLEYIKIIHKRSIVKSIKAIEHTDDTKDRIYVTACLFLKILQEETSSYNFARNANVMPLWNINIILILLR